VNNIGILAEKYATKAVSYLSTKAMISYLSGKIRAQAISYLSGKSPSMRGFENLNSDFFPFIQHYVPKH
jgi:hypothetical protein